ncbi:MAG TPA: hypothetical protein VFE86_13620 [Ilumatobacteraceae bacterium]|nr:hypothetical protein [Ilumatobacteraceae bacterium]
MSTRSAPTHTLSVMAVMVAVSISACGAAATHSGSSSAVTAATTVHLASPVSGYVEQIYSTGDFILNTGTLRFTIMMSPTTAVLNVRGRQVPRQFIAVAGPVDVTGTVAGATISAQTIRVPTRKDDP